jgi:hypothetical protein
VGTGQLAFVNGLTDPVFDEALESLVITRTETKSMTVPFLSLLLTVAVVWWRCSGSDS